MMISWLRSLCISCIVLCILKFTASFNITEEETQFIHSCNTRSYGVFNRSVLRSYVTTDPNSVKFGGFGNFVFTILSAHHAAFVLERVVVMNNLLFSHMFEHPDPRQTWDLIPSSQFVSLKKTVKTRPPQCKNIEKVSFRDTPVLYGVNGCHGAYMTHPDARPVLTALIPKLKELEGHGIPYPEATTAMLSEWTLSRPTARWTEIMNDYKNTVLSSCSDGGNSTIDVAVQFRTWRDISDKGSYDQMGGQCYQKCAAELALEVQAKANRSICVFVTSDNETSSALLVEHLNSLDPVHIRAAFGATESNASFWHTDPAIQEARWTFDPATLVHHQSLKDWMMLSMAKSALYTSGSTFAYTARLRQGLRSFVNDRIADPSGNCTCRPGLNTHDIEVHRRMAML